jgi:hypothetical protein
MNQEERESLRLTVRLFLENPNAGPVDVFIERLVVNQVAQFRDAAIKVSADASIYHPETQTPVLTAEAQSIAAQITRKLKRLPVYKEAIQGG